jgi:DNA-binding response OmpR family regulator
MIKVIVADCTPSVYTVIAAAFPRKEFEIFSFSDGAEMIAEAEAIQPDVILLSLSLNSRDGYDVCSFLNTQESFKTIPLFLLVGAFERVDRERITGLKYRELIEEPFDSTELLRKVRETLRGERDPQTLPEEPIPVEELPMGTEWEDRIKILIAEHLKSLDIEGSKKEE